MVRRSFGSLVDAAWFRRQLTRDADAVHDAAHGVRMLAKSPGFTAVALLVLATGIGASTAIASLTDALLFRRLPIPDADRVVTLWERNRLTGVGRDDVAPGNAIDWVTRTTSFAAAAAVEPWSVDFTSPGGEPEVLNAARVTERFFDVTGVPMLHGRAFTGREYIKGNDRVAILSYGVWKERFGEDPSVIDRVIQLDTPAVLRGRRNQARRRSAPVRGTMGAPRVPHQVFRGLRAEDPRQWLLERPCPIEVRCLAGAGEAGDGRAVRAACA